MTDKIRTIGIWERRPNASKIPHGSAPAIPTDAIIKVSVSPPHCRVSTRSRPKKPPYISHQTISG
ncbi:Uncharacterised protein [Shigella sonnei]|nr:Uncharacterised protein [Shigella sonnei]